jgi:general secretion pathway protein K
LDRPAQLRPFRADRGFALLIVLWMLVLIAFITTHVTAAGRTEVRIATNLAANAVAQAAADGAIFEAIFNLSAPRPDQRWKVEGGVHELQIGESRVTLRVDDEAGRINPSLASAALLAGLLRAVGSAPDQAADLAAAIAEWVGSAQVHRKPDELLAEYRAAGLDYGPPESPLESIDELGRVRGISAELLGALRPHLTLFGPAEPDPASASADPVVAAAIASAANDTVRTGTGPPTAAIDANGGIVTARILATARGPGNAEVRRTAIVQVGPVSATGYSLLAWENGIE